MKFKWLLVFLLGMASCAQAATTVEFIPITNNITTEPQLTLTGIATNTTSAITTIECRVDGGSWQGTTASDGTFNSNTERFSFRPSTALVRSTTPHLFEARVNSNTIGSYEVFIIGDRPEVALESAGVTIIDGDPIDTTPSFEVTAVTDKTLTTLNLVIGTNTINLLTSATNPNNNPGVYFATYTPTTALADGSYTAKAIATDSSNKTTTQEATNLVVQSTQALAVQGQPLNHPNPFNPVTQTTSIGYVLSRDASIILSIFDLMGNRLYQRSYTFGTQGGKAGYNEVIWNGRTDSGQMVGNGIYVYLIIGGGKILNQGRLAVIQ